MATNDPFGDFRRRRSSLFDEFFSEFFDRPFGIEGATGLAREPPRHSRAGQSSRSTSRSSSRMRRASFYSAQRNWRSTGAPWISTPSTCCGRRCRTTSSRR